MRLARSAPFARLCCLGLISAATSCAPERAAVQTPAGQNPRVVTLQAPPQAAPTETAGARAEIAPSRNARYAIRNNGIFAALGAPGGGMAAGSSAPVSPFGGLSEAPGAAVGSGYGSAGAGEGRGARGAHGVARRGAEEPSSAVARAERVPATGLLTAASVGDNDRRGNYTEFLSRHDAERDDLALDMSRRVRFHVVDARGRSVNDASIDVAGAQEQVGRGRSHLDGGWDWFPSLRRGGTEGAMTVRASSGDLAASVDFTLPARGDVAETITVRLPGDVDSAARVLDLGFLIDSTGSMGDELRYVNSEISHIVERIETTVPNVRVRVGAVFYRDRQDAQQIDHIQFTTDTQSFAADMQRVTAMGGGDYPEDMNHGLEAAFHDLSWSDGNADRILVVIADAPPQHYSDQQFTWHEAVDSAAHRGVRIVPVAASGADRAVEYLFRAMGAATSTPYVYLTDDSGVGAPHLAADTDHVTVERFADLLVRFVASDLQGSGMHEPGAQS
ncbi:MAG: VWA domain-containing protein [Deltaproteobacteria bacterium]